MIEVNITSNGGELELGRIKIIRIQTHEDGTADYSVQFAADRVTAVGMHQRVVYNYPRTKFNALALVRQALNTLEEDELKMEEGVTEDDLGTSSRGVRSSLARWNNRW